MAMAGARKAELESSISSDPRDMQPHAYHTEDVAALPL